MEWNEIISTVLKTIVTGVVTFGIPYLFSLIRTKTDNELLKNMIDLAEQTCVNCVLAVDQTFVDELKKNGQFTPEKQKEAFELCKEKILSTLDDAAKEAVIVMNNSLEDWIAIQIESTIKAKKLNTLLQ